MNKSKFLVFLLVVVSLFSAFGVLAQSPLGSNIRLVNAFLVNSNNPTSNTITVTEGGSFNLSLVAYSYGGPLTEETLKIGNFINFQRFDTGVYTNEGGTSYYRYTKNLNINTLQNHLSPGTYTLTFYANSGSLTDNSSLTLIVKPVTIPDTTAPIVKISFPVNGEVYDNLTQVNHAYFRVTESNLYSCWYSLNGVKHALSTCLNSTLNRISNLNSIYGINNLTIYAMDKSGNIGNDTVKFKVKKVIENNPPIVNIKFPLNKTYSSNVTQASFIVTGSDQNYSCWYKLNGVTKQMGTCLNFTITAINNLNTNYGSNNLTVYAKDNSGAIGSDTVIYTFEKAVPPVNPLNMTILVPENNKIYYDNVTFRVETNKNATVVYSLDSGANVTMSTANMLYHISNNLYLSVGWHNATFCATSNDNSSEVVCESRQFVIKKSPTNNENKSRNSCENCVSNVLDLRDPALENFYNQQQAANDAKKRAVINLGSDDSTVAKKLNLFQRIINWFSRLFGFGNVY